jgi:hypothetical protein
MAVLGLVDLIEEAFERIGVNPRAGYDFRSAKRSLNILLSDWANRGLNLWTVEERSYPVAQGQASIVLDADIFDVMDAVIRDPSVTPPFDLAMDRISPTDYLNVPYKDMPGTPTQYMVRRGLPPMTMFLWQVPDRAMEVVVNQLKMLPSVPNYQSAVQIPERFQAALISGLAYQLAIKRAPQRLAEMRALYEDDYERAAAEDRDRSSFFFAPDIRC